jgi:hypothetical protein
MANPLLLDLAPEPSGAIGLAALIIVVMLVLGFTAALIVGFVFLLKRYRSQERDHEN